MYDPKVTAAKTGQSAVVLAIASVIGTVLAPKLQEWGVTIDTPVLTAAIITVVGSAVEGIRNWIKHRKDS